MARNSAQALASGIRNIDRFQKDIRNIMQRVATAKFIAQWADKEGLEEFGLWKLFTIESFLSPRFWVLEYAGFRIIESSHAYQELFQPPLALTGKMYRDMSVLIDGLMAKFPDIAVEFEVFFEAAELE